METTGAAKLRVAGVQAEPGVDAAPIKFWRACPFVCVGGRRCRLVKVISMFVENGGNKDDLKINGFKAALVELGFDLFFDQRDELGFEVRPSCG